MEDMAPPTSPPTEMLPLIDVASPEAEWMLRAFFLMTAEPDEMCKSREAAAMYLNFQVLIRWQNQGTCEN
jgi:hypothetical protein